MANKIQFELGTTYRGEGFQQLDNAIKANQKSMNAAKTGMTDLTNAIKGISPEAAVATNGVTAFLRAFATGGVVGGVITLALQGVAKGIEFVGDKLKESKEKAEAFAAAIKDKAVDAANAANAGYQKLLATFKDVAAEAKTLNDFAQKKLSLELEAKLLGIDQRMNEALAKAHDEAERAFIRATAEAEKAELKLAGEIEKQAAAAKAATDAADIAAKRRTAAEEALAKATEARAQAYDDSAEYARKLQQIEDGYANEIEAVRGNAHAMAQAEKKHKEALDALNSQYAADIKRRAETDKAVADAERAVVEAKRAERDAANAAALAKMEAANAEQKRQNELDAAAQKEADAKAKLADALSEQAAAAEAAAKGINETTKAVVDQLNSGAGKWLMEITDADANGGGGNGAADKDGRRGGVKVDVVDVQKKVEQKLDKQLKDVVVKPITDVNVKPRKLDEETWEKIKAGTASVAEIQRFKRFQEMEQRYITSSQSSGDLRKFFTIAGKDQRIWSKSDREFMQTYAAAFPSIKGNLTQQKIQEAQKKLLNSDTFNRKFRSVEKIEQYLNNLGLK